MSTDEKPKHNPESVVVAYMHGESVAGRFHQSLVDMVLYDISTSNRTVFGGGGLIEMESGPNLASTRNEIVKRFLSTSSAEWLLTLDTDMTFELDLLDRLMEHADPVKAPIVGALCFSVGEEGVLPTLYDLAGDTDEPQPVRYVEWPENTMMQVFATGAACMLIHRSVLEGIRDYLDPKAPGRVGFSQAWPWYQEIEFYGRRMSEDITLCLRAGVCGFPVYVHTGVQVGHIKKQIFGRKHYAKPADSFSTWPSVTSKPAA